MLAYRCEEDRSSATDLLFHQVPLPSYKQTPLDDLGMPSHLMDLGMLPSLPSIQNAGVFRASSFK